jgi:hypothetical protein
VIRIPCSCVSNSLFRRAGISPRTPEFRGSAGQFGASLASKKYKFPVNFAKFPVNLSITGNFRQKMAGRGRVQLDQGELANLYSASKLFVTLNSFHLW